MRKIQNCKIMTSLGSVIAITAINDAQTEEENSAKITPAAILELALNK